MSKSNCLAYTPYLKNLSSQFDLWHAAVAPASNGGAPTSLHGSPSSGSNGCTWHLGSDFLEADPAGQRAIAVQVLVLALLWQGIQAAGRAIPRSDLAAHTAFAAQGGDAIRAVASLLEPHFPLPDLPALAAEVAA